MDSKSEVRTRRHAAQEVDLARRIETGEQATGLREMVELDQRAEQ